MNTLFSNLHLSEATYETGGCPHNLILAEAELTGSTYGRTCAEATG